MARVAPDADVLIGFFDERDAHHDRAREALAPHLVPGRLVVAASVYAEIMVRPLRSSRAEPIDALLAAAGASVVPITREIALVAAGLRAAHAALRLPDALALATARAHDARLLTFDERLRRVLEGAG